MMQSTFLAVRAAAVVSSVFAATTAAPADIFTFDIDGPAALNAPVAVGALDMAPGNMLFIPVATDVFHFSHQASLVGLVNASGLPVAPAGLNSTFEVTVVSSVQFTRTFPTSNTTVVQPSAVQPANAFIEIWYDTTPDANALAGTGYNDGTRIYFGSPSGALPGALADTIAGTPEPYDQFGADNYPGQTTSPWWGVYGFGSTTTLQDPSFFLTPTSIVELSSTFETPFDLTNPSANYVNAPGGAAPVPGAFVVGLPFQADGALQFTAVPEPAGLGVAAALAGLTLLRRRRVISH